ncbi:putative E3 ubiquitin-protein ligase ubr11 [Glarea lozoyensis 74030]|uniref:E3 ubiquitin-protein ligase n=1 Tax=Glarea lozoyensis (strain ATCC 74030 / MF5533) TaxID=1104152 RepID=H0EFC3_GLAL7|nr:putative E3 ubiquitin-protein ligase ubr11 [Glarea lozoyensis 74030]
MVYVSISLGNSGCCDCGDPEAWRIPVHCSIHTDFGDAARKKAKGKAAELPQELVDSIRMTIGRTFDYICDVISCSPEQLRLPKSKESILEDEKSSRLGSEFYNGDVVEEPCEYALLLWNDEKHTVYEVRDQVARACKTTMKEGLQRAHETDDVGRSIVKYSFDIDELLRVSQVIEQIKVTVTIRSARDTFREQMCGSIIEWLSDIAGCSVGQDHDILRQVICEEMLKKWSFGSSATNRDVGMNGIDDHEMEENRRFQLIEHNAEMFRRAAIAAAAAGTDDEDSDDLGDAVDEGDNFGDNSDGTPSVDEDDSDGDFANAVEQYLLQPSASQVVRDQDGDTQMTIEDVEESPLEHGEATEAGFPPPPPPPPAPQRIARDRDLTPSDSDTAEMQPLISEKVYAKANMEIPKTPRNHSKLLSPPKPARYWLETSPTFKAQENVPLYENLQERLRLDWMILFDLRMWKKVRIDLRDLYIATVVTIPEFKRVLGLRFAGLYTTLAQLYLIADREPDHSIINISLQMLTTPTITSEIVERGNFLTNLMAILYTFLTTRQVGHPHEISPNATLAFDSGSVTNRRMYHFFLDLKYLSSSEHIQEKLRREDRYMLQFLDLVKLHQGICPNTRAVGDHVEYETDAWISASLITREINRLCRQFSESFQWSLGEDPTYIQKALRLAAKSVILNSLGAERKRFDQAEIKDEVKFKKVGDYEFDTTEMAKSVLQHSVVNDRTSLVTKEDEPNSHILAMRRDITHVLCFKPLSFTEICNKLPDKFQDQEECQDILDEMTTFKPPEGLSDVGSFELKEQYLEDVDPYISHYTKNQREESENAYKAWLAKKTGRPAADIVFEPKLRPIESGTFSDLSAFTRTGIFAQIIYYALLFPLKAQDFTPTVPVTRVEAFLQVVLHLVLIAILEDKTDEDEMSEDSLQSFVYIALTSPARSNFLPDYPNSRTIAAILEILSRKEEFKACHPKIALVLKRMKQKRPRNFDTAFARLGVPVDRISTASPANSTVLEDREKKKQAAMDRQAKVMAQFQQQQKNFLANQGDIDWGEDGASDIDVEDESENHKTYWPYPTGTCILCQEETKDGRLYGTFALITPSTVLRQTPFGDPDFVREVLNTPANLDHSADSIRPCGVAGENREEVHKVNASGVDIVTERQFIGKGFPAKSTRNGPVSVGCGHIMHYKCFEVYYEASQRRHQHQIARHHPEVLEMNEFVCPLCKALGNSFLPIIWTPKEEIPIQQLQPQTSSTFDDWLYLAAGPNAVSRAGGISSKPSRAAPSSRSVELFMQHNTAVLGQPLASKMSELLLDAWEAPTSVPSPLPFGTPTAEPSAQSVWLE